MRNNSRLFLHFRFDFCAPFMIVARMDVVHSIETCSCRRRRSSDRTQPSAARVERHAIRRHQLQSWDVGSPPTRPVASFTSARRGAE